ncbi:hypothetical protein EDC39_10770 [Geothermobacter ehrlichii]|uniref:Oxygen tolerance protein BatD n=1 Tax=Geothermobacter ehrlichii TaxID=213224 RepID=A0A5D3WJ24_9BACT|nr:BatD family protein [Geothermobacter ehrlichii]TYO98275.1 hypothetical protein EDC39_10770 [Geothermobacter ehrlichii]
MNRLPLPFLLLWPLLLGAAPLPALQPADVRLGEPVVLQLRLPDAEWSLAGLPDLPAFRLLQPPRTDRGTLTLRLLPVRPGPTEIPPLTLVRGNRVLQSRPLPVTVTDPVAADTAVVPRQNWPPDNAFPPWLPALALTAAVLLLFPICVRIRRRKLATGPYAAEKQRLAALPPSPERQQLERELLGWCYGPYTPDESERADWRRRLADLERRS